MTDLTKVIDEVKANRHKTLVQLKVDASLLRIIDDYAKRNEIPRTAAFTELSRIGHEALKLNAIKESKDSTRNAIVGQNEDSND